ncbi:MAG TPA: glycosyltransferase family 2 protein [Candidatus Methanoperedens sp.]|nr:glycosyltransferase family 2 protein [Candidatus Methanoperedens sp.]
MKSSQKIVVIIPVYNENQRAVKTIKDVLRHFKGEIVVVDDGSTDNTKELVERHFKDISRLTLISYKKNKGKGAALRVGVEMAWKKGGEAVIFIDADGQHNPKYLKKFKRKLEDNKIVFGYRMLSRKMPFLRRLGNIVAVNLIRVLFNIRKKDLLSGYLGFKKEIYEKIKWTSDRYGIETEMATKIGRNKLEFYEFKIDTIYIDKYKGVTLLDAIKVLAQIPRWYFTK